jgi:S-DNA-T family DNA segregation ATPase FtsK/SpoIIIE
VLIAGATGAGKGSVIWSLVRTLAPAVRVGLVQVWVCDPKGGMEFAAGKRLFARFAATPEEIAELLEAAVAAMRARAVRLAGLSRLHAPRPGDPLLVVVVDELASLTAYAADRDVKRRVGAALGLLLSQGRAAGVAVIGAVQDPRKDVVAFRDLFPVRVALRMTEAAQVDLVLGDGAHERGAYAERIPVELPGVGFVLTDADPAPVRVRASWISDAEIAAIVDVYGAPSATQPHDSPAPAPAPAPSAPRGLRPAAGWVPDVTAVAAGWPALPAAGLPGPDGSDGSNGSVAPVEPWGAPPAADTAAGFDVGGGEHGAAGGGDETDWEAFAADYRRRHGLADDDAPPSPGG